MSIDTHEVEISVGLRYAAQQSENQVWGADVSLGVIEGCETGRTWQHEAQVSTALKIGASRADPCRPGRCASVFNGEHGMEASDAALVFL